VARFFDGDWEKNVDFIASYFICNFLASSVALLVRIFSGSWQRPVTRLYVTILLTLLVFLTCGLPFSTYWFFL
jgi:Mas-related G protein-coupled receptor protein X